jgi:HEAT repeat protein
MAGRKVVKLSVSDLSTHGKRYIKQILSVKAASSKMQSLGLATRDGFVARDIVDAITPALIARLDDRNRATKLSALELLGNLGSSLAQQPLLERLMNEDLEVASWASLGLARLEHVGADLQQPLLTAFEATHHSVRLHACEAIFRLRNAYELPLTELLAALSKLRDVRWDVDVSEMAGWLLERNRRIQIAELNHLLPSPSFGIRLASLKALWYRHGVDAASSENVRALLQDEVLQIRVWASIALAANEPQGERLHAWIPQLTDVIALPWEDYRMAEAKRAAVRLLAKAGEAAAASTTMVLKNWKFGGTAWELPIEAFGKSAIRAVEDALDSGVISSYDAVVWLAKLGAPRALELADTMISEQDYPHYAARCLGLLGSEGLRRARQLLKDPGQRLLHKETVVGLSEAGREGLALMSEVFESGTPDAKVAIARAAGERQLEPIVPQLTGALRDSTDAVRIASACALVRLGHREAAVKTLIEEYPRQSDTIVVAIAQAKASVPELLPSLLAGFLPEGRPNSTTARAIGLAAESVRQGKQEAIDTLRRVSGFWSLRKDALEVAARLERPDIAIPFPSPVDL